MNPSIDFNRLIHAAIYFLSYQDRIGRSFMINESSLKFPIADYLTSLEIPSCEIQLEYPHPILERRRIDLVILKKSKMGAAFEFKIAKPDTRNESEQKRIFNDLMRLYLIVKTKKIPCYFLIVGKQNEFISSFRSIANVPPVGSARSIPKPNGFYTEWFNFKINKRYSFKVKSSNVYQYKKIYGEFLNIYKSEKVGKKIDLPINIKTKCIGISALSRNYPIPYVGGIWKVG